MNTLIKTRQTFEFMIQSRNGFTQGRIYEITDIQINTKDLSYSCIGVINDRGDRVLFYVYEFYFYFKLPSNSPRNLTAEWEAIRRFLNGEAYRVSTFIDEVTTTYGYGKLDSAGGWEYELPPWFLKTALFENSRRKDIES